MRLAEASDADSLTRLINAAFSVERFFLDSDRLDIDEVRRRLAAGAFLIEEDRDALLGCVYIEIRGERGYIGLLSVDPARQRNGLGKRMMAAAEDRCHKQGCRFVDLQIVNIREELPGFYRSLGYTETGVAPFPADVFTKMPCHFVNMSKPLPL